MIFLLFIVTFMQIMPVFQTSEKVPPPWLIAMQRYGPPPSYPNLKIPGLNAPIPDVSVLTFFTSDDFQENLDCKL